MGLAAYLCVSVALFALGLCCAIARRSLFHVLMGLELILVAANIDFAAFARFSAASFIDGRVAALFGLAIAAAEAVVGLAIVLQAAKQFRTTRPSALDRLRE